MNDENRMERTTRILTCELTTQEITQRGERLAALCEQIEQAKDDLASNVKDERERIKALELDRGKLAYIVIHGVEERPVECMTTFDYRTLSVYTVRTDTGEELDRRPMTEQERQRELPINA